MCVAWETRDLFFRIMCWFLAGPSAGGNGREFTGLHAVMVALDAFAGFAALAHAAMDCPRAGRRAAVSEPTTTAASHELDDIFGDRSGWSKR